MWKYIFVCTNLFVHWTFILYFFLNFVRVSLTNRGQDWLPRSVLSRLLICMLTTFLILWKQKIYKFHFIICYIYIFLCQNAHDTNFYQFLLILINFGLIWGVPKFSFQFYSIDNNLSCLLYFRLPSFSNFLCTFCLNMHKIPIFANFD